MVVDSGFTLSLLGGAEAPTMYDDTCEPSPPV